MVTIYKNFSMTGSPHFISIHKALLRIKTGRSQHLIENIRLTGNKESKLRLPCVLFSGQFSYRNSKSLIGHSGFICLDFDKFPDHDTLNMWRDNLEGDKYTYSVWLSPSGSGLKCLVKIPKEPENHKKYFDALKDYYDCKYFDVACSDVCRICFESYDPELQVNEFSTTWTTKKVYPYVIEPTGIGLDSSETVRRLLLWSDRKFPILNGNRNVNMFKLSASFNDFGVSIHEAERVLTKFSQEDFNETEIKRIIRNGYKDTSKHGRYKF